MAVERFSKEDFERALTYILWAKGNSLELVYLGLVSGEYEYRIPLPPNQAVSLAIRSSVDKSGFAAEAGADSIRVWLVDARNDEPIGNKAQSYITRVPGWQKRLGKVMRELAGRRMKTGDCHVCYAPISIYEVKKDTPNKGRLFGKCTDCGWWWGWLDKPDKKVYFKKGENYGDAKDARTGSEEDVQETGAWQDNQREIPLGEKCQADDDVRYPHGMSRTANVRDGIQSGGETYQRGKGKPDLPKLLGGDEGGGLNHGETDIAKVGGESASQLYVPPADSATAAKGRQDGADGLPEAGDSESNQEGEGDRGKSALPDLPGGDDSGGGLSFLAEDSSPAALIIEGEEEAIEIAVEDYPPTEEQQAAIVAPLDKPVRVLAGPGSGKTFLLAHRYKYLVENGVNPQNILAVTFTKEMANALGQRILAMCPEAAKGIDWICTIHAACYRILKSDGDRRSVPKWWKIKRTLEEAIDYYWPLKLERPGYKDVLSYINSAKANGLQYSEDKDFYSGIAGAKLGELIALIREKFDDDMYGMNHLIFSDMLLDIEVALAQDDVVRRRWQSKFHYVIVDEAQDTSGQAMRILATLAEPQNQLTIVGDSDQLLFRFAGATPEVNLSDGFERRYPDDDLYKLTINWRSTKEIVDAQLRLIRHNYESLSGPYEDKYIKELQPKPDAVDGEPVSFQWYRTPEEEALGVAGGILEDMSNGYKAPDFFIASRTRAQTAYIEGALVRAGIQYINLCGGSFWALKHVQDVVSYVRLAHDQDDDAAFRKIYNIASSNMVYPWGEKKGLYCPHRYLGHAFLDACEGSYFIVRKEVKKMREGKSSRLSRFFKGLKDLVWLVGDLQAIMATETVADLVGFILDHCYLDHLKAEEGVNAQDEAEDGKLADLATIKDIARGFKRDVGAFLNYVNEMIEAAERARQKDWSKHVVISTVHRLKGLERKIVYSIGWCEGLDRLGFPVGLLPHTFSLRPPPQTGVLPVGGKGRIEDERCIAFVAISRAKEKVRLSGFEACMGRTYEPSRFVGETLGNTVIQDS